MFTPPPRGDVLAALEQHGITLETEQPFVGWFGDSPELSRELLALVLSGQKTATAGLAWGWEIEEGRLPRPGDVEIVLHWGGAPAAVIEYTWVAVLPFAAVPADYAYDEGEDDRTLASWRAGHWRYFTRECERMGWTPSEDMPVVCTRFRLLHVLPRG
jgi:uncharacterized protein YhfF